MVQLNIIVVLAVVELLMLLSGLSGFLWFRGRKLAQALAAARKMPPAARPVDTPPPGSYASFLNAELARAAQLEGIEAQLQANEEVRSAQDGTDDNLSQGAEPLLAVRRKFIENELAAQDAAGDLTEYRQRLLDGLYAIELPVTSLDPAAAAKLSQRYEEELARLRTVIGNQHDIMRELETIVAANSGSGETAEAARRQLDLWERQAAELERCVGVLEMENRRLRAEHQNPPATATEAEQDGAPGSEGEELHVLIGNQQETINQLNQLVQGLVPEAEKARQLTDIIGRIERANKELNTCVAVLEDENGMLRGRIQELEAPGPDDTANNPEQASRIQELEAELHFKDTAIEELQQQHQALESKYLALQGEGAQGS